MPYPIRQNKIIRWPSIDGNIYGNRFVISIINKKFIKIASDLWTNNFPNVTYDNQWLYDYTNYEKNIALKDHWEIDRINKQYLMINIHDQFENQTAAMLLFKKIEANLEIHFKIGFVASEYRKNKKSFSITEIPGSIINKMENESGAEYFTATATTLQNL